MPDVNLQTLLANSLTLAAELNTGAIALRSKYFDYHSAAEHLRTEVERVKVEVQHGLSELDTLAQHLLSELHAPAEHARSVLAELEQSVGSYEHSIVESEASLSTAVDQCKTNLSHEAAGVSGAHAALQEAFQRLHNQFAHEEQTVAQWVSESDEVRKMGLDQMSEAGVLMQNIDGHIKTGSEQAKTILEEASSQARSLGAQVQGAVSSGIHGISETAVAPAINELRNRLDALRAELSGRISGAATEFGSGTSDSSRQVTSKQQLINAASRQLEPLLRQLEESTNVLSGLARSIQNIASNLMPF